MTTSATSLLLRGASLALRTSTPHLSSRALCCLVPRVLPSMARSQLTCAVPVRGMAMKADQELATFLKDEIATEKQNSRALPKLAGWEVKTDGSEVTLTKTVEGEKVMITFNVNHTVDSAEPDDGSGEAPEMLSKPTFEVDLIKPGGKTLSFTCSFTENDPHPESEPQEEEADIFAIDEVTMFEGENHSDSSYAVAGDILDGYLYDVFMNMMAERGVDSQFCEQLQDWCSAYEHGQYVGLLGELERWSKL